MDEFPCHGNFLNNILKIGSMNIVIMFGSGDGCLSSLTLSFGMKSRSC